MLRTAIKIIAGLVLFLYLGLLTKKVVFKKGGLPIEKFADTFGRPLTIKQMRELDEYDVYFDRAGL